MKVLVTGGAGFDLIFMACTDMNCSLRITDDRKMYERARESSIDTITLTDWETGVD